MAPIVVRPIGGGVNSFGTLRPREMSVSLNQVSSALPTSVITGSTTAQYSSGLTAYGLMKFNDYAFDFISAEAFAFIAEVQVLGFSSGSPHSSDIDVTAKVWLMENNWDPSTVTWDTRPTLAGPAVTLQMQHTGFIHDAVGTASSMQSYRCNPAGLTIYGLGFEISAASPTPDATNDLVYRCVGSGSAVVLERT